jgi:hypothetical protein
MEVTPKLGGEEPSLRAEEILAALDEDQRAVALATRGPVCVIAGAGTGNGASAGAGAGTGSGSAAGTDSCTGAGVGSGSGIGAT